MFKIEVTQLKQEPKEVEYPCFKESKDRDVIVLFSAPGTGTVIACKTNKIYETGHYSNGWDEASFNPFCGELRILSEVTEDELDSEARKELGDMVTNDMEAFIEKAKGSFGKFASSKIPCGTPGCCPDNPAPEKEAQSQKSKDFFKVFGFYPN